MKSTLLGVVLLAAAAPLDRVADGNASYRAGDYTVALGHYESAEAATTDPGLVAFNKAAALYRRGKYADAEQHFRRCLADDRAPRARLLRALYGLGNCLVRRAGPNDPARLRSAILCYRRCLAVEGLTDPPPADVRHNLEVAKLLWAAARKKTAGRKPGPNDIPDDARDLPRPGRSPPPGDGDRPVDDRQRRVPRNVGRPTPGGDGDTKDGPRATEQTAPGAGELPVLADTDELQQLTPREATAHLRLAAARIKTARRQQARAAASAERPGVRNW